MAGGVPVEVLGAAEGRAGELLTPEALEFVASLQREFGPRRAELLAARAARRERIAAGELPDFLPETRSVRESAWSVAPVPEPLRDRRCEITGPVERKMMINALNSGARVFMADFEDANSPTWANCIEGQVNCHDAVRRTIELETPDRSYRLNDETAVLLVRPRGWHLPEKHVLVDGEPVSGSLFDFGLYLYWNGRELLERGLGPYFYLPKLEGHLEARLWNDVFCVAQDALGIPRGIDQGDRARRDHPRRVRDGRDPVRAPRALGRAQRRPLGLHLQRHQDVPRPRGLRASRPGRR